MNYNQTTEELCVRSEQRAKELIDGGGDATYLVWPLIDECRRLHGYVEKLKLDISGHKGVISLQFDKIHDLQLELSKYKKGAGDD